MIYYARVGVFLVKTKGDEVDGKSRVPFLLEKSGFSHVQNQKGEVVVYRNHTLGKISSKSLNSIALNAELNSFIIFRYFNLSPDKGKKL